MAATLLHARRDDPGHPAALVLDADDVLDEDSTALLEALNSLGANGSVRAWDPAKHPRNPKGSPGGGRFKSLVHRITDALKEHLDGKGDGDPFEGFSREQLRRVAKARGIDLPRGASREYIAKALLDDISPGHRPKVDKPDAPDAPHAPKAPKKAVKKPARSGRDALRAAPIAVAPQGFKRGVRGDLAEEIDVDAFHAYRGEDYTEINGWLRSGEDWSEGDFAWQIATIDVAMQHSRLTSDVLVYRVVEDIEHFEVDTDGSLVGFEFLENGYSSTSADPEVADDFFDGNGVVLRMRVPAGTGAVQLSDFAKTPVVGRHRDNDEEAELLLEHGLKYRVISDQVIDGRRELDVEVVRG